MKKNLKIILFFIGIINATGVFSQSSPSDKFATEETKKLYKNLKKQAKKGVMFGHQDDLAYGVGWQYIDGDSDVKRVCGQYPAVFGWDLGHIELDSANNLDGVPFEKIKQYIKKVHAMGGVSTITWHLRNPVNGKSAWDVDTVAKHILIGGDKYPVYEAWMAKVAGFFNSLKDEKGKDIPVIFRPFHEHNGSWFWWGKKYCSPEEYKLLYQQINQYMASKGVHNLLYAYSTDNFPNEADYLERFPNDNFVDIVGFDTYHRGAPKSNEQFINNLHRMLTTVENYAKNHHKIVAITETGLEQLTEANWWTNVLLKGLEGHQLSYVLVWRNGRPDHYYAPYINQKSAEDFKIFVDNPKIILQNKVQLNHLYR